jgi:hypothetical protein
MISIEIRKNNAFFDSFSEEESGIPFDNALNLYCKGKKDYPNDIFTMFIVAECGSFFLFSVAFLSIIKSIDDVLTDALDRVECHICDIDNNDIKFNGLSTEMKALYLNKQSFISHEIKKLINQEQEH